MRSHVQTLAPGTKLSVIFFHGQEQYGTLSSSSDSTFILSNVDTRTDHTVSYEQVKKVKEGYGGYNSFSQRHTDHTKGLIFGAILIVGLTVLVITAARS